MLILGYGNSGRGDDAAGALAVRRLRELGVPAEEFGGDGIDLLSSWSASDNVVVIDAMVSGGEPGSIRTWEDPARSVIGASALCSTHGIGILEAVRLGAALGRLPARLRIIGIEAAGFTVGSEPSAEVTEAASRVAGRLAREVFEQV